MQFLGNSNLFEAAVQCNVDPSADNHLTRKSWVSANAIMGIHTDSQVHAEVVTVSGEKQLKIKSLAITDVQVDSTETSLANWVTNNYTGSEVQEGDMVILTNTGSDRTETYIHNGGTAGTTADFTEIQGSDVSGSEVRSYFSGGTGITYNSTTGEFSVTNADIRGLFSGDGVVAYNSTTGAFSWAGDTSNVSENGNLYFTDSRARLALSVSGNGISYNSGTGVFSLALDTDDVAEGTALYFTQARSRSALSVVSNPANDIQLASYDSGSGQISVLLSNVFAEFSAGTGLSWDGGGEFSLNANTDNIQESASPTNKYFTDARARGAVSAGTGLAYDSGTGAFSLDANTDNIQESASPTNKYFTDARARSSIDADSNVAQNILDYDQSTGLMAVDLANLRKEFTNQSLTANTWLTLNHNLGIKLVQVSIYDSNGDKVILDTQLVDSNNVRIRSAVNKTGMDIVVSL